MSGALCLGAAGSVFLLGAMAIGLASCGTRVAAPDPYRDVVRLATGPPGGGFFPTGENLAREYRRLLPSVTVDAYPSEGAVANVEAVQKGDVDVAFAFADVAYFAFVGRLSDAPMPFDRLAGMAVLEPTPVQLVVGAGSGIKDVADLRGRRVAVGPRGSGTALTAALLLSAFGVQESAVEREWLPFNRAAERLVQGSLDAMFDDAIYPTEAVRIATAAGARLLPLSGPPIERLRRAYPFFRLTLIPRGAYPGVDAIHTIGVDSLLVCRKDLDSNLVYALTSRFIESLPSLSSSQHALRFMDLDHAPATPIPLHEGAARYYRERELMP